MVISTINEIYKCINSNESFILDAGAGSGKTWSLIESLKYVINKKQDIFNRSNQKIVCITYTNVAKNEIIERLENNGLVLVSTIHDFLWACLSPFKKELKEKLVELIDDKIQSIQIELDKSKNKSGVTYDRNLEKKSKLESDKRDLIQTKNLTEYRNFSSLKNNIISHDEVITLSSKIFSSYSVIKKLISDEFPMIFVDEYQDTFPEVIEILLGILLPMKQITFGFFGDKMQKIYDKGIGEIPPSYKLKQITKSENYRCSLNVIDLLNKIRSDIKQFPAGLNAEVEGSCKFYRASESNFELKNFITDVLSFNEKDLKVLFLTHKLIAKQNGYDELYNLVNVYNKTDALTKKDEERCPFIKFLYLIENIVELYLSKRIQELLYTIDFDVNSFNDKEFLKDSLDELINLRNTEKIGVVYNFILEKGLLKKSEQIKKFDFEDSQNKEYYESLFNIKYKQIINSNIVAEEQTPFSTKHGTKGAEFKNVLVVIDDTAWRNYSFDKYFSNDKSNEKIYNRTKNLFYVVCSRAEENLNVLSLSQLSHTSLSKINYLFNDIIELN